MIEPTEPEKNAPFVDATFYLSGPPPPLDVEFTPDELSGLFSTVGLSLGRCFGSKSAYRRMWPSCIFMPNANVFCRPHGKVWWGDLDLRTDKPALRKAARLLGCRLYVLHELDGRFQNATLAHGAVIRRSRWHTGGKTRVRGLARFLRRSGLSLEQLAQRANVPRAWLTRRQPPEIALDVYRRLTDHEEYFGAIAAE